MKRQHAPQTKSTQRLALAALLLGWQILSCELIAGTPTLPEGGFLYVVNTTSDSVVAGACETGSAGCSLRGAIQAANSHAGLDGIDISLPAGSVINLTQALPGLSDSVDINGSGPDRITVRRNTGGDYRIFDVGGGITATFSGMTISNGRVAEIDGQGGGITTGISTVNVINCTISGNFGNNGGGGISSRGTLNITNSTISGNSATGAGGGVISEDVNITNSTISGNATENVGGGILAYEESNIINSTINGNTAREGGGIFNFFGENTYVANSVISNNSALGDGGGIAVEGELNIINSTISGNVTAADGGGIYNSSGGNTYVANSTISGNTAHDHGGGIFNLSGADTYVANSTISGNHAGFFGKGGGICNDSGTTLNVSNSTIRGNQTGSLGTGGGISNESGGTLDVTNSTITSNSAGDGGGISGTATLKSCIIALNTSPSGPPDLGGSFTSQGFNLIGNNIGAAASFPAGNPNANNDIVGTSASPVNPQFDPNGLQNNGGPTRTIALQPGSPAIDKGTSNGLGGTLTTDQRGVGFPRKVDYPSYQNATGGDGTDIGAVEFGGPLLPISVSRKGHGDTGFDYFTINLPLTGTPGIECRTGGASGIHQLILGFPSAVTVASASVTTGIGSVSGYTVSGTNVTVDLTGVANAQTIVITLFGVSNGTNMGNVTIPMGMLLGDTNGNRSVNASDISQTKAQSGAAVTASNFRTDVNVNGSINASDISLMKSKSGTALP